MKVRWTADSVRMRITPGELEALTGGRGVLVSLPVAGPGQWTAQVVPGAAETGVAMLDGVLRLSLSAADVMRLADPDAEGVYFEGAGEDGPFRYYVEKDFPCEHPRASEARETLSETFPRPNE